MIKTEIKSRIDFPKIALGKDLEVIARSIIIPDMKNRIKQRKAIDGGALPKLEKSTSDRKGHDRPLENTGELLNSFIYSRTGENEVQITLDAGRYLEGTYLQGGIKTNHGYKRYRFFGISVFAERKALKYMKDRIKAITNG